MAEPDRCDTHDLIVIGAGGAGLACALAGAIRGLDVLLVEHTAFVGGTTAYSAGTIWVPGSAHAVEVSPPGSDSADEAAAYLDRVTAGHGDPALRRAFLAHGPEALALLEAHSHLKLRAYAKHPDYESDLPGARLAGRALEPLPFDGRRLGRHFGLVRPPIPEFTVLGGMMVDRTDINHLLAMTRSLRSLRHALGLIGRHALDRLRHPRGTRLVMGNALVGRLLLSLVERRVPVLTNTAVQALSRDADGRVTGVVLRGADGVTRAVAARGGVVLASGGFNRHPRLRAERLPAAPSHTPGAPGHTGEALELALAAGARLGEGQLDDAFWAPVSRRQRADGSTAVFPHFVLDRAKPGTVVVNAAGERFVNESVSYHRFGRAMFAARAVPAFLIADAAALRRHGLGMVRPGGGGLGPFLRDGYLTTGATLDELAARLGIDAAGLRRTVARMNALARLGDDPDFGRGRTDYQRHLGDPAFAPNPNLGPITQAPFYAVRLYPGDIGAASGLVTDADARVLGTGDAPIDGLYAIGNDMNSIMGGAYPGPGITIGPALVFASLAARHVAGRLGRTPLPPT